jgi:hypothetical protein
MIGLLWWSGCASTVEVYSPSGAPVFGAEVFVNGAAAGQTNGDGRLVSTKLGRGDTLFARARVEEVENPRRITTWTERVYITTRRVGDDGGILDLEVPYTPGTFVLTLDEARPLLALRLAVSLAWDASSAEIAEIEELFRGASQYLYNATDGQFLIEVVEIEDRSEGWTSADVRFDTDNSRRPATSGLGSFLEPVYVSSVVPGPAVRIGAPLDHDPDPNYPYGADAASTLAHELGHLVFGLRDEYLSLDLDEASCTEARGSAADDDHRAGGAKAACIMDDPARASKLCTAGTDNAHNPSTLQLDPCWEQIRTTFEDGEVDPPRWRITTPDDRGVDVGALETLPPGLLPTFYSSNHEEAGLCAPFVVTDLPAAGGPVWVMRPSPDPYVEPYSLGVVKSDGRVLVSGAHLGDSVVTTHSVLPVDDSVCIPTE